MKKILIAVILLVLLGGGIAWYFLAKKNPLSNYSQIKVERGDLNIKILSTGIVQPENRLSIKSPISGRVDSILVNEGDMVKKGQVLAWISSLERAALLDSARATGVEELKKWEELYKATPIMAPISGRVILRNMEPGQSFTSADAIIVLSDRLTVKAQLDETDIGQIHLKQKASIVLDAYPDKPVEGLVDQIAYDAKTVNNVTTYIVDVLPNEIPIFMRSGMTANVTVKIETKSNVILIPNEALKSSENGTYVMVPGKSKTPEERLIQVGVSDGKQTEVINGLEENEIILKPILKLGTANINKNPFAPMGGGMRRQQPRGGH